MELWSWYEFDGIVIFSIENLQTMDLFFALSLVSRYIDLFGEEYVIEYVAETVNEEFNDYEFITNLPYDKFYEINGEDAAILFSNRDLDLSKL